MRADYYKAGLAGSPTPLSDPAKELVSAAIPLLITARLASGIEGLVWARPIYGHQGATADSESEIHCYSAALDLVVSVRESLLVAPGVAHR